MRALALVGALALAGALSATNSGCAGSDPAEVKLHDEEIDLLGSMARASGKRSPAQVASVTACVASAHATFHRIARPK